MKRFALAFGLIALTLAAPAAAQQQMTDPDFHPTVARPAFAANGPVVVIDGAHNNFHTVDVVTRPSSRCFGPMAIRFAAEPRLLMRAG